MDILRESGAVPHTLQMIDSTVIRAHPQAAGTKGVSARGFRPLKRRLHDQDHLLIDLIDAAGLPVRTEVTPWQASDCLGFGMVMAGKLPTLSVLLADRGYDAGSSRKTIDERDLPTVLSTRKSCKKRAGVDRSLYWL